ncbi:helix-turn-helix domain-containing protein [Streptomyces sp. NPDC001492]
MTERESETPLANYPAVLTAAEVAEIFRLSPVSIARRAKSGQLKAFRGATGPRAPWRFDKRRIALVLEGRPSDEALPPLLSGHPEVLTAQEVGDVLRYDPTTVAALAAAGRLPGFKTSPRSPWRFRRQTISALIEGTPPGEPGQPAAP